MKDIKHKHIIDQIYPLKTTDFQGIQIQVLHPISNVIDLVILKEGVIGTERGIFLQKAFASYMFTKGNVAFLSRRTITQHGYQHRVEYVPKKRMYAVLERKLIPPGVNRARHPRRATLSATRIRCKSPSRVNKCLNVNNHVCSNKCTSESDSTTLSETNTDIVT